MPYLAGHGRCLGVEYVEDCQSGCWVWQRYINPDGYGTVGPKRAHRVYYERYVGPIPEGMDLDHLCRNKTCVNPAHLEPVTEAENVRRGRSAKLSQAAADEIRSLIAQGRHTQASIADQFSVCRQTITFIKQNRTWVT